MLTREGRVVWVRDEGRIVQNDLESPLYLQGILVDITSEKRIEEEKGIYEKKLSAIHRLTTDLALVPRIEEIARISLDICQDVLNFDYCSLCLIDETTDELKTIAQRGHREEERLTLSLKGNGITVWVCVNGRSLLVSDVTLDSRYIEWIQDIRSELCVPMNVREKTIGVMNVESKKIGAFGDTDRQLLETLASEVAIALQNAAFWQDKERRIKELASLNVAFQDIGSREDFKERLNLLVQWATNLLQAKAGALFLYDSKASELELFAHHNFMSGSYAVRLKPDMGLPGMVFTTKMPKTVRDCQASEEQTRCIHARFKSAAGVPIVWKSDVVGILMVAEDMHRRNFSKNDVNLLENFANFASVIIANSRLSEMMGQESTVPSSK
jgi:GAF domain-containing protein